PHAVPLPAPRSPNWVHIALLFILLGGLAVRLLAVRDLLFPPWVDAVRHGLIATVMASSGKVLTTYEPWLPVEVFPYHFGFHTIPASLTMMTGWPLPHTLLILGQLLNALVPLSVYAAAWLMTRRRGVGLVAAFLVAFPFLFPGYYATWGRYTQLAGMLVLPLLIALTWHLIRGGRRWKHAWWVAALLASGLFLIHLRVFLYYLPFPLLVWFGSRFRRTRALAAAGSLTLLLVGIRAWQLFPRSSPAQLLTTSLEGYNDFPMGYVTAGWEELFVGLALLSIPLSLVAYLRGRRWAALPLALAFWVASLFLLLAGRLVGLPESWLVNLNSMYIILFFPVALLIGLLLDRLWSWSATRELRKAEGGVRIKRLHRDDEGVVEQRNAAYRGVEVSRVLSLGRYVALGLLLTATLLFGVRNQLTILNRQTILAFPEDSVGLEWVAANLPDDARIGVSAWRWLGDAWAGTDGGAWLLPLTGHATSTPPADYVYNPHLAQSVIAFNETATAIEDWSDPAAATWLREQGITHLFIGTRGGFLDPAELARNPTLKLLYQQEGAFIFTLP
ncbi:MAG: hypothetical protein M3220_05460, partial [Chloroflexota bacterium]|nr:hypothetical protein [Chloroflexota bacterium]